jgi:hypothetical protein
MCQMASSGSNLILPLNGLPPEAYFSLPLIHLYFKSHELQSTLYEISLNGIESKCNSSASKGPVCAFAGYSASLRKGASSGSKSSTLGFHPFS